MNLEEHKPLKKLTWMKVGGPADYYAEIYTKADLLEAFGIAKKKKLPVLYLGQGSNMIMPDEGIRGMVLRLMNGRIGWGDDAEDSEDVGLDRIATIEEDGNGEKKLSGSPLKGVGAQEGTDDFERVYVEGGVILAKFIREARNRNLNGLDNFVGIPGTVGAAVRGNIGIPAEEFCEIIESVECFDGERFFTLTPEECEFRYRHSKIKDEYWLVWSAKLRLRKGEPPHKDEWLMERIAKQPKGHSCGSFFKNPDLDKELYAGKIIDEMGLKGMKIGGAFISEQHGNFLMNDGSGTAGEIAELAKMVKEKVFEERKIEMENEVLLYDERCELIEL
ncbi:MAG: UDP-N-acetylmuramate dehydrogenase [Candidatus Gracilibacteria bacterium]|nr:UDP-N-acetylmuramate dehydrogenase [Candidatus Gracilibacteria bacterium]